MKYRLFLITLLLASSTLFAQQSELAKCNLTWNSESKNSGESMPCGGGDIGLNVWVENHDIYFYISRSGTFDENNTFLKLGRVRLKLSPNPFEGAEFSQTLNLPDGSVIIKGKKAGADVTVKLWVDVFRPVIHAEVNSKQPISTEADFESWRYRDRDIKKGTENNQDSYKWSQNTITTFKDNIDFNNNSVQFYHHNHDTTAFDRTVSDEGMASVKDQMYDPLAGLTFGGKIQGDGMKPAGTYTGQYISTDFQGWRLVGPAKKQQNIEIYLNTTQDKAADNWLNGLQAVVNDEKVHRKQALTQTQAWWKQYWERSYIYIDADKNADTQQWQTGRNYQLFRYMLGCNAFGAWPTKFNGGLFTYDPVFVNKDYDYTPDFRNWGGGLMTAQNQRLVYWPMLKSGDVDMMKPQFDFYLRSQKNAELRSQVYWGHKGAAFTEQIENFGLPNRAEYGLNRPAGFENGLEYNNWLEYTWDTCLEFCLMMLETERYTGKDIKANVPFIESCLTFFNEHYQYLALKRGIQRFDGEGHLVFFPGSSGETFKMAYNSTSTIAGLQTVLKRLLELPDGYLTTEQRKEWETMLKHLPPLNFRDLDGHKAISPAVTWQRVNNEENMQLYPVFPWGIYGIGKPDLDVAINTWKYDTLAAKFRSGVGWKQDNIFAARMGMTKEAAELTTFKLKNSGRRFPAFWGPGFDWTPDHNWGGSGMIGLQDMLMQVDGHKIYLLPAWPKDWDVHFKLHAPYNTTVEAVVKDGKVTSLQVFPKEREKDVVNMLK